MLPLWAVFVVLLLGITALRMVMTLLVGDPLDRDAVLGSIAWGVVWAGFFTFAGRRIARRVRATGLDHARYRELDRAVRRGVLPADPELRAKAPAHARTVERSLRTGALAAPVAGLAFAALMVFIALDDEEATEVGFVLAAVCVLVGALGTWYGLRVAARVRRLRTPD